MSNYKYRNFYFISLALVLAAAAYPIYMGVVAVSSYLRVGYIGAMNYPKYVIPYAPMCIGIILAAAVIPLAFRYLKRYTLPACTALGAAVFLIAERLFEQIPVYTVELVTAPLESWQLFSCVMTPQVEEAILTPVFAENNPAFKLHFYLIALAILMAVIHTIYGYSKMLREENYNKRRPLNTQLVCTVAFVALCIYACLTAFYRTGDIHVAPVSAFLMCLFFVTFGVTFGSYFGCLLYGKGRALSVWLPTGAAMLTTVAMYIGELMLMGGELFILGNGLFFRAVGSTPFAPIDFAVILLSGAVTWALMNALNKKRAAG